MDERSELYERRFELPIVIAALLVIPIIVIEQSSPGEPWSTLAIVGNWVVWSMFLAEVVVMLAIVPDRGRWLREHPLEIAIVVLTPPFLPASLPQDSASASGTRSRSSCSSGWMASRPP